MKDDTYTWHCRLGHIGKGRMKQLFSDGLLQSFDEDSFDQCEDCLMGKKWPGHRSAVQSNGQPN